jgi:N-acetylmuramoyl-L-alanine amidase
MKKILIFTIALFSFALGNAQVTLYIDAAHGGKDAGAIAGDGSKESALTLQFAQVLSEKAKMQNIHVVMIREKDEFVQLTDRSIKTDNTNQAYFVSIHMNSSNDKTKQGTTIIMQKGNQLDGTILLGRKMMHNFNQIGIVNIEQLNLEVLRNNTIPSVVVSPGYVSNESDLAKLKSTTYQEQVAATILKAILE